MRIGVIGMGTIGQALCRRWSGEGPVLTERGAKGVAHDGSVVKGNKELVGAADLIVVAVKPQHWAALKGELGDLAGKRLLSVMAGVPLAALEATGAKAARLMPNLALAQGEGLNVIMSGTGWTPSERRELLRLLAKLGKTIEVQDEGLLDVATGLSGSGIAYLLAVLQAFAAEGERRGLAPEEARKAMAQVARGAAALLDSGAGFDRLIAKVASRGGTTEQGLAALRDAGLARIVGDVMERTIRKAEAMRDGG